MAGIDPDAQQDWRRYALHMLIFNVALMILTYIVLRVQYYLPGNPQGWPG